MRIAKLNDSEMRTIIEGIFTAVINNKKYGYSKDGRDRVLQMIRTIDKTNPKGIINHKEWDGVVHEFLKAYDAYLGWL